jgi:hypothetical protein
MMIPDSQRRLEQALAELAELLVIDSLLLLLLLRSFSPCDCRRKLKIIHQSVKSYVLKLQHYYL